MAWLDDRLWAHPKINQVSPRAFQAFVFSITYSSGFGLYGVLTEADLRKLHVGSRTRQELVEAALWHNVNGGGIEINDWAEHNSKRDAVIEDRRKADRERKRRERERKAELSRGQSRDTDRDLSRDEKRDDPPSRARTRTGAPPMTSDRVTDNQQQEEPPTDTKPTAAAAAINTLERAGWTRSQLDAATTNPRRALAWLSHLRNDPSCSNPAGLAWTKFQTTNAWPEAPLPSVAPGASGTRSTSPPLDHGSTLRDLPERTPPPTDLRTIGTPDDDDPEPTP